jgi:hypothetical protein
MKILPNVSSLHQMYLLGELNHVNKNELNVLPFVKDMSACLFSNPLLLYPSSDLITLLNLYPNDPSLELKILDVFEEKDVYTPSLGRMGQVLSQGIGQALHHKEFDKIEAIFSRYYTELDMKGIRVFHFFGRSLSSSLI